MAINSLPLDYLLINEYKILKVLGQGGFGITYLAQDIKLGHRVVIKEFIPQNMAVRDQGNHTIAPYTQGDAVYLHLMKRFIDEARVLAKLRHPNIVEVVRMFEANDTAYFVMKYEEGETLADFLKHHQQLTEEEILIIMMPILEGVKYSHLNNILHRDIAPDNIYLKSNGMPMLIDFGSARYTIAEQTQMLAAIFKDGYSPPEQYNSNEKQAATADIYALGAVMYRIVTGTKPISAQNRTTAYLNGDADPLIPFNSTHKSRYSHRFLNAINKALRIRENERFESVQDFQKALTLKGHENKCSLKKVFTKGQRDKKCVVFIAVIVSIFIGIIGYYIYVNLTISTVPSICTENDKILGFCK